MGMTRPGDGDAFYRVNGAGEMLAFSAADFEDFLQPRPDVPPAMESDLTGVVTLLARHGWPFRLHATYDETITRALDVFERVHREAPIGGLHWFFDHAETIPTWKRRTLMSSANGHAKRSEKGLLTQDNCVVTLIGRPLPSEDGR